MELLNYLLKVSACSALFFAFYLLVLRKLTFFKINRFYLLLSMIISFVIPAMQFTIEQEITQSTFVNEPIAAQNIDLNNSHTIQIPSILNSAPVSREIETLDWLAILPYLYGCIVASLLFLTGWRIIQLLRHTKAPIREISGLKLIAKEKGFTNCSFFNYIFIDENSLTDNELKMLLAHEQVHAKQYHSIDKLVLMIAKAFLWFNPIVYLYDKALEQVHEYEADEVTSKNIDSALYASLLLKLAVSKSSNPLLHNFVKSPIKQRIRMLFNSKSKNMKKLVYLSALPIGLGLIWGFTVDIVKVFPQSNQQKQFTLVIDAGHGGKKTGAQVNGVSEKEITLSLSKKLKALAEEKGINVIETRINDTDVSLQERIKAEGSVLISLHVNSQSEGNTSNGVEMYISPSKDQLKKSKSTQIAHNLYESLKKLKGIAVSTKYKEARLLLLENIKLPAVLLEVGYLTNKSDFQFLKNDQKQDELVAAIVDGILNFKKTSWSLQTSRNLQDTLIGKTVKGKVLGFEKQNKQELLNFQVGSTQVLIACDGFKNKVKIGDELNITLLDQFQRPPAPIGEDSAKWNERFASIKPFYRVLNVVGPNWTYKYVQPHYAFAYEANRARSAFSTIKSITKGENGIIHKIVLKDEHGFTIDLNVAGLNQKNTPFNISDRVEVKFIGEKLTGDKAYSTEKLIALYSLPRKYELINKALYPKFYVNGKQKPYVKAREKTLSDRGTKKVMLGDQVVVSSAKSNFATKTSI